MRLMFYCNLEEEIDEEIFIELEASEIKEWIPQTGIVKKLQKLQEKLKVCVRTLTNISELNQCCYLSRSHYFINLK